MITSTHYLQNTKYILSRYIYEYDMSKANISVLYSGGIITKEEYEYYFNLPKSLREKEIGIRRKDQEFDKILDNLIREYRIKFIQSNNISDDKILSIKNDAIFVLDNEPTITTFDNVQFLKKNVYTSYFNLNRLEVYYYLDIINNTETIDVKGIKDDKLLLHQDYFLNFLCTVFDNFQNKPVQETLNFLSWFYNQYIKRNLDLGYYREFNSSSKYSLYSKSKFYKFDMMDPKYKDRLDISCNLNIIRELYQIASNLQFSG